MAHLSTALVRRISYRHGIPFLAATALALVTTAWPHVFRSTSIWTFALLAFVSTAFALIYGGRFCTFFIAIAVIPPFLFILGWFLRRRSVMPDFPTKVVSEYFLYFVAAPILVVWIVATMLNRKERHA
jgi:hypothetical protein